MNQLCMFMAGVDYFVVGCPTKGKTSYDKRRVVGQNRYYKKSGKTFKGRRVKMNNKTKDMRHNQRR